MAEAGSFGYPTRENLDSLLDAHIKYRKEAKAEVGSLLTKLEFLLMEIKTVDGFYTFPDGDTLPCGMLTESASV